ncbi:MAG: hypothetical protein GF393_12685 [Armatimonadia bacterium]|nr:hypothetical protein [Armatimonadia bacterium]
MLSSAFADDLIPEHGKYSQTYMSDWSELPTGRELARHDPGAMEFVDAAGQGAGRRFVDEEEVRISGERLRVTWESPECDKYGHTLYYFRNCERVIIEDMAVIQNHGDWRSSSTFFFESCDRVEIRDCYLAGTSGRAFIRIEGCAEYFVDGVEIAGMDFGEGYRCGPGIFVNNGAGLDPETGRQRYIYDENARDLRFGVIQNCYIHDYEATEEFMNHDGILFHAPADGIVFNCWVENWEGDSAIDDSHRRNDVAYQDHLHRIERCVFRNCHRVKTNGAVGSPSCSLLWCNNLYVDSSLTDYHTGWENWRVHETYAFTRNKGYFHVMHYREGLKLFRNCLLHSAVPQSDMYESMGATPDQDIHQLRPNWFMYLMPEPGRWLFPRTDNTPTIETWDAWRAEGFDANSTLADIAPRFVDAEAGDYRLLPDSPAAGAGTSQTLTATELRPAVTHDFYGKQRSDPPSCGAFEVADVPGG